MSDIEEKVDILIPPKFEKTGIVKTREQAWDDEDWIGTFNLWIIQKDPVPSIVYQQRSLDNPWSPGKLDVAVGGHYSAGETIKEGLREAKEELGKDYDFEELIYLGKKMHVGPDTKKRMRHNVIDVFMIEDNSKISEYTVQEDELYAVTSCPIVELIKVHTQNNYVFKVDAVKNTGEKFQLSVNKDSFPFNWDNYHFKMALIADRFIKGENNLLY